MKKTYYSILHFVILLLTITFFIFPLSVVAENGVSYNNSTKQLTIIADVSDKANDAAVIVISKDSSNTLMNVIRTGTDGEINHIETMPEFFAGGRYDVKVSTINGSYTDYFIYPVEETILSVLPVLNAAPSASRLLELVVASSGELAVDMLIFGPVQSDASEVLYALRPQNGWQSANSFLYGYNNSLAAVELKKGTAPATVFSSYGAALDIDAKIYANLTTEEKGIADSLLLSADYKLASVKDTFMVCKALAQLRSADNWSEMKDKAFINSDVLNFDLTYYNKLTLKDLAYQKFYAAFDGTETINELRDLFLTSSKQAYQSENEEKDNEIVVVKPPSGGFGGSVTNTPPKVPAESENNKPKVSFIDVNSHWGKDAILSLAESSIINGYEDGSFKPDNFVTRAEFTTMVVKALDIETKATSDFADVVSGSWYESAIGAAYANGIILGGGDGNFRPDELIKRQDVFVILNRAFENILKGGAPRNFSDIAFASDYAKAAIDALSSSGIVSGNENGELNPLHNTTRAEVASLLNRIILLGKE